MSAISRHQAPPLGYARVHALKPEAEAVRLAEELAAQGRAVALVRCAGHCLPRWHVYAKVQP